MAGWVDRSMDRLDQWMRWGMGELPGVSGMCVFSPDAMVYIPSFDGTSYLELRPLSYLLQSSDTTATLSLSVKTKEPQGTILYSEYKQIISEYKV